MNVDRNSFINRPWTEAETPKDMVNEGRIVPHPYNDEKTGWMLRLLNNILPSGKKIQLNGNVVKGLIIGAVVLAGSILAPAANAQGVGHAVAHASHHAVSLVPLLGFAHSLFPHMPAYVIIPGYLIAAMAILAAPALAIIASY